MAIVTITYLEMRSKTDIRSKPCPDPLFRVEEAVVKQWEYNRFLYSLVGGPWQWNEKLVWDEELWRSYAESPFLRTFSALYQGSPAGYFELHSEGKDVEISYFGLAPKFIGKGLGGYLLSCALEEAWKSMPERVWVHTCDRDHPSALVNYQARGLKIYKVEHIPL